MRARRALQGLTLGAWDSHAALAEVDGAVWASGFGLGKTQPRLPRASPEPHSPEDWVSLKPRLLVSVGPSVLLASSRLSLSDRCHRWVRPVKH